jgi:endonuclease YncB( thermonuclease family)
MLAYLKKAPLGGAFFVVLTCLLQPFLARPALASDCEAPSGSEFHRVSTVIDGDTLRLKSGETVRLIGIDTPELGRDGNPDSPYARQARDALKHLVEQSGWRIRLRSGIDPRDRYRRRLAHLYTAGGGNLTAALLRQGLGYQAVVAPNTTHLGCYREAEQAARNAGRGLWSTALREVSTLDPEETGFHLARGEVKRVRRNRHSVWLELAADVSVRLPWDVWQAMTPDAPESFLARRLELRGWFYRYKGRLRVTVSHPAALRWL